MASELRILIVDDNDDKRARVVQVLREKLVGRHLHLGEASTYEDAIDRLRDGFFDLVILDLLLPAANAIPTQETSRALMRLIKAGKLVPPSHIIGLTEHRDVGESEQDFYRENLFALEFYDAADLKWADRIIGKITYLLQSKTAAVQFHNNSFDLDIFVLAARHENEYVPIKRKLFRDIESTGHPIWKGDITFGTIKLGNDRLLRGALACVGEMGMAPTAAAAAQAIALFRPRLISMLGMCCGFSVKECASPRKIMDAIVVRQVACWEEGKYIDEATGGQEFQNRAKTRMVDDAIRDSVESAVERSAEAIVPRMRRFVSSLEYQKILARFGDEHVRSIPDVRFSSLVTGSSVIADEAKVRDILQRHPAAIGLDMELFGLYTAAEKCLGRRPSVLGIKGVADYGHAQKDDAAQRGASAVATEVFKAILPNLPIF